MIDIKTLNDNSIYYIRFNYESVPDVQYLNTGKYIKERLIDKTDKLGILEFLGIHKLYEEILINLTNSELTEVGIIENSIKIIDESFEFINDIYHYMDINNYNFLNVVQNDDTMEVHSIDSYKSLLLFIIISNLTMENGFEKDAESSNNIIAEHKYYIINEYKDIKEICDLIENKFMFSIYDKN